MELTTEEFLSDATNRLFHRHYDHYGYEEGEIPELPVEERLDLSDGVVDIIIHLNYFKVSAPTWVGEDFDCKAGCGISTEVLFQGYEIPRRKVRFNDYTKSIAKEILNIIAMIRSVELDTLDHDHLYQTTRRTLENIVRPALNDGLMVKITVNPATGLDLVVRNRTYHYPRYS